MLCLDCYKNEAGKRRDSADAYARASHENRILPRRDAVNGDLRELLWHVLQEINQR